MHIANTNPNGLNKNKTKIRTKKMVNHNSVKHPLSVAIGLFLSLLVSNSHSENTVQSGYQQVAAGKIIQRVNRASEVAHDQLPTGGQIQSGLVNPSAVGHISSDGAQMTVQQNQQNMLVNWDTFNIGESASVTFKQPNTSSIALNRVNQNNPSQILGNLNANGHVWLLNSAGVYFGKNATVNVGGLVASSLSMSDDDFHKANYKLTSNSDAAPIVNEGNIRANVVAMVAPEIVNNGVLVADNGQASMVSAQSVTLDLHGDNLINIEVDQAAVNGRIENGGLVRVDNGQIIMTASSADQVLASAINNSGLIQANRMVNKGGKILLEGDVVTNAGEMMANGQGSENGGAVQLRGSHISTGKISADGSTGGEIQLESSGTINSSDRVSARGTLDNGGNISYMAAGKIIKSQTAAVDVQGVQNGGNIEVSAQNIITSSTYNANAVHQNGGRIDITASNDVTFLSAMLSATGATQGGLIRLGGPFQGKNYTTASSAYPLFNDRWGALPALQTARETMLNDATYVDVSSSNGMGGAAVIWSDAVTTMLGGVNAAGALGGGGVEISSSDLLRHASLDDVNIGQGGQLLLDPRNIYIQDLNIAKGWVYNKIVGLDYQNEGILADIETGDSFGSALALDDSGLLMAIGLSGSEGFDKAEVDSGAVFLYQFSGKQFTGGSLQAVIGNGYVGGKNIDTSLLFRNQFGTSVSMNGDGSRLVVGAPLSGGFNPNRLTRFTGEVLVFDFDANPSDPFANGQHVASIGNNYDLSGDARDIGISLETGDQLGSSVALNQQGNLLAVGAISDDGLANAHSASGAVYLFSLNGAPGAMTGGQLVGTIGSGYNGTNDLDISAHTENSDLIGHRVALNASGDRLIASAYNDGGFNNTTPGSGAVHFFSFADNNFGGAVHEGIAGDGYVGGKNVNVDLDNFDRFGSGLAMSNNSELLMVGAFWDNGFNNAGGPETRGDTGAVYFYEFTDSDFNNAVATGIIGHGYTGTGSFSLALDGADYFGSAVAMNGSGNHMVVGATGGDGDQNAGTDTGEVYLFSYANEVVNGVSNSPRLSSQDTYITPESITDLLNVGTDVALIASNNIFIDNDVIANNLLGNSGGLTLSAGNNIGINANITLDNADLEITANDLANPGTLDSYRTAGTANITMQAGTQLDAGTGNVSIIMKNDPSNSLNAPGAIALTSINANKISVINEGTDATSKVVLNGQLEASATGDAIEIVAGQQFINNAGANALKSDHGRWLVWSANPAADTTGGLNNDFKQYDARHGETVVAGAGNGFLYSVAPLVDVTLVNKTEKVYDANVSASLIASNYSVDGVIQDDVVVTTKPATGHFDNKNVGVSKGVTSDPIEIVSSVTSDGKPVYGYKLKSPTAQGNIGEITPKVLNVAFQGVDKVHDGNALASLVASDDRYSGDEIQIKHFASFEDAEVGANKLASVSNVQLAGADAMNYQVVYNNQIFANILEVPDNPKLPVIPQADDFFNVMRNNRSASQNLYSMVCTNIYAKPNSMRQFLSSVQHSNQYAMLSNTFQSKHHPIFGCFR